MTKEVLGHVTCPHCGNTQATVHRQAKGSRALYYRCYGGASGDCGTVQIILAGGQGWIKANMRPLSEPEAKGHAEAAALDAKAQQMKKAKAPQQPKASSDPKAPQQQTKPGMFSRFFEDSIA